MPLSPELRERAVRWRLSAAFVNIDDPKGAATALLNTGKGTQDIMLASEIPYEDAVAEVTRVMEEIVAAVSPEGLEMRRNQLESWLTDSTNAEIGSWNLGGVYPWEEPIWTTKLEELAAKRGLKLPWKR